VSEPSATPATKADPSLVEAGANQPRLLQADEIWLVRQGAVDVFAVPVQDGGAVGPRQHLARVEAGQALFGVAPLPPDAGSIGLLAVGVAGTQLQPFSPDGLAAPGSGLDVAALVDAWVTVLSDGLTGHAPPAGAAAATPGSEVTAAAGQSVGAGAPVVWLGVTSGAASYLGDESLSPLGTGGCVALTPRTWLVAREDTGAAVVDTAAVLQSGELWPALGAFHDLLMERLALEAGRAADGARERLERQAQADRRLVGGAVERLARVLQPRQFAEAATVTGDPFLEACALVAGASGLVMAPPSAPIEAATPGERLELLGRVSDFRVRRVVLTGDWWREDNGPLLAFRVEGQQPVALLPRSPGRYVVVDPQDGKPVAVDRKVAAAVGGLAFTFYRVFPERALSVWDLLRFGRRGSGRDLLAVLWVGALGGLVALVTPIATGIVFQTLIPTADRMRLIQMTVGLIVAALAAGVFEVVRATALLRFSGKVEASLQAAIWDRVLNLPAPFFRGYSSGDLALRANAIELIQQIMTGIVISAVLSAVFSVFSLLLLFYYSVWLAIVATVVILLVLVVAAGANWVQLRRQREVLRIQGAISGLVFQLIGGMAKLRVAAAEPRAFAAWARDFAEQRRLAYKGRQIANGVTVFTGVWIVLASLVLFGAIVFWIGPGFNAADFLAFSAAFGQFFTAVLAMTAAVTASLSVVPLYERARPILQTMPEVGAARSDPGPLRGAIELSHVSFRYSPEAPLALHDVALAVKPGQFVAFVGPSGSGKSTLFRMLLGFETPSGGAIFYDGRDLAGLDLRAVRRQIGVVLQNGRVMAGSIFENIVGTAPLTQDDAWEAARGAGLEEDIKAMPMGMQTFIAEGAATLSGGQRQRLMIARAIVRKPRILLFDEATSALDNETQAIVSKSLAALNATRIVIAHRLSTIVKADRIFVIDGGRVVESGTYDELMALNGAFAALAKRQLV